MATAGGPSDGDTVTQYPAENEWGLTALHLAAAADDAEAIRALVASGLSPDVVPRPKFHRMTHGQDTPLHTAARKGNTAAVAALLQCGATPGCLNRDEAVPAAVAMRFGRWDAAVQLLEAFPYCSDYGRFVPPRAAAVKQGRPDILGLLVRAQPQIVLGPRVHFRIRLPQRSPMAITSTMLWLACAFQQPECLKVILKYGPRPLPLHTFPEQGLKTSPLAACFLRESLAAGAACISLLLAAGADATLPERNGSSILHFLRDRVRAMGLPAGEQEKAERKAGWLAVLQALLKHPALHGGVRHPRGKSAMNYWLNRRPIPAAKPAHGPPFHVEYWELVCALLRSIPKRHQHRVLHREWEGSPSPMHTLCRTASAPLHHWGALVLQAFAAGASVDETPPESLGAAGGVGAGTATDGRPTLPARQTSPLGCLPGEDLAEALGRPESTCPWVVHAATPSYALRVTAQLCCGWHRWRLRSHMLLLRQAAEK